MNSKLTNKSIQKTFKLFNESFFDKKIPLDTKVCFANISEDGLYSYGFGIKIKKNLNSHPDLVMIVLLHEMIHAYLEAVGHVGYAHDRGHGSRFHVEIDRLFQKGAYEGLL